MATDIRVTWVEKQAFLGYDSQGRGVLMSPSEPGQPGTSPMQLLLLGLGGCASYDIVSILQKQRAHLTDFSVTVSGERGDEAPRPWKTIHMHFTFVGHALDKDKVERAIHLSTEKYCGVHGSLSGVATITWGYEIKDTEIPASA